MELEDIDVTGNGLISKKVVSRIAGKKMIGLDTDLRGCMRYKSTQRCDDFMAMYVLVSPRGVPGPSVRVELEAVAQVDEMRVQAAC